MVPAFDLPNTPVIFAARGNLSRCLLLAAFAGALKYDSYGPLLRLVMKLVARRAHLSTDTTAAHDYTDWPRVQLFAREFGERLEPRDPLAERAELAPITLHQSG